MNGSNDEFSGRFVVERRIGAGGMGVVYRAYDCQRNEHVAIKTLRHAEPGTIYRLKREFRSLADLVHPNLVTLYELFSVEGEWFFTMEFVDGIDFLSHVRSSRGPADADQPTEDHWPNTDVPDRSPNAMSDESLSTRSIRDKTPASPKDLADNELEGAAIQAILPAQLPSLRAAFRQLAEGISALHRAGKLHRDVKPSNVLVSGQGRVVVLDFGLATEYGQRQSWTTEGYFKGTVAYASPEQAAGLKLSPATDWYSVGVMLYEALTGRRPFLGNSLRVLMAKQEYEPPPPSELAPGVPDDLNSLCVELLRQAPEVRLSGPEVLRRVGSSSAGQVGSAVSSPQPQRLPFVGRAGHLAAISDAFSDTERGRTVLVYVHGKSGVGKTALVERFLDSIRGRENTVILAGRCYERESVPYKGLDCLIDALSSYLVRLSRLEADAVMPRDVAALSQLFPVLRRIKAVDQARQQDYRVPDRQELRERAFGALRELLARLGDRKRLVLHIDDLQWGDLDSAALLNHLLRPPDPPVLLLLICYRSEGTAINQALATILEPATANQVDVRHVGVGPLNQEAAQEAALALLGADDSPAQSLSRAIARESGGNPYFVDALVRHRQRHAQLSLDSSIEPVSLRQVLWDRIECLTHPARRLLEVVAVAGHPLRQADAFRAAEVSSEGPQALRILCSENMVRTTGCEPDDEVETYHDRIRETVASRLSGQSVASRHRSLAHALEASGQADAAVLALHFAGAEEPLRAGEHYAAAAADAAEALAFDRAADLYRLAVELRPDQEGNRRLRGKLADALANAGRGHEAAGQYLAAAGDANDAQKLELQRRAAMQYLFSGHIDKGLDSLRIVLAAVGMNLPRTPRRALGSLIVHRARLWMRGLGFIERNADNVPSRDLTRIDVCGSAAVGLSIVDPVRAADFQARSLLLALRSGEPCRIARSLAIEAGHVATAGSSARRRVGRILKKSEDLASRIGDPYLGGMVALATGIAAYLEGRWQRAVECCDRAEKTFRDHCTNVAWELDTAHGFSIWSLYWLGQVGELSRRRQSLLVEARERGDLYALANLSMMTLPDLAADDPGGGESRLRELIKRWSRDGFHIQHADCLYGQTLIDVYRGQGDLAYKRITQQWPALVRSLLLRVQVVRFGLLVARARCALAAATVADDPSSLCRAAEGDARRLKREKIPGAAPLVQLIRGGVASLCGDTSGAVAILTQAVLGFDAAGMALYAAAARRSLGEVIGGRRGAELIEQADSWMGEQNVQDPQRMSALYTPGYAAPKRNLAGLHTSCQLPPATVGKSETNCPRSPR